MAGFWSAENATKAYLKTLNMGRKQNEPDEVEFISALAAGSNAQVMVAACAGAVDPTVLVALVSAAHQTGGRVICILRGTEELDRSEELIMAALGDICHVEFAIGDAQTLLLSHYSHFDFALIDCNLVRHEQIIGAVQTAKRDKSAIVVARNALKKGTFLRSNSSVSAWRTQLLPIGEGLLVTRLLMNGNYGEEKVIKGSPRNGRSNWVVKVDKCTGEEHVFRVRSPVSHGRVRQIQA